MRYLLKAIIISVAALIVLPVWSIGAETQAKKAVSQVPVTYPGDTDKTIARRAQLIEGAKKEGAVTWWSSIKPEQSRVLITAFKKIYPFIDITFWRGQDQERETRIESEHSMGKASADLCDAGDFTEYARRRKIGMTEKYTDLIPNIQNYNKNMYSKFGDWAQLGNNAIVPMYNTNNVKAAEAPKSWEDLLDPKWKGGIGLTSDVKAWYVLALGEGGWGIEKTEAYLKKLKQQQLIWATGHSGGYNLLVAGEYKMMGENYLRYLFDTQKKGVPVDWVKVRPVPVTGGTFFLLKKAPHPNSAKLFIEWLFSHEGLELYEQVTGYGAAAPGSGTMLSKALAGLPLVYRSEEVVEKTEKLGLDKKFAEILGVTPE